MAATCSRPAPATVRAATARPLRRWPVAAQVVATAWLAFASPAHAQAPVACFAEGTDLAEVAATSHAMAFEASDPQAASLSTRWLATATNPTTGSDGDPITLTWGVVGDGTPIVPFYGGESSDASGLEGYLDALYGDRATWVALFQQVFDRWDEVSGIRFVHESADDAAAIRLSGPLPGVLSLRPDIRISGHAIDGGGGIVAYAYRPGNGDIVLDTDDSFYFNLSGDSVRLRNALAHEVGHAIGLQHVCPTSQEKLMEPIVGGFLDGPQADDISGASEYYGDALEQDDSFTGATDFGLGIGDGVAILDLSIDSEVDADWNVIPDEPGLRISVTVQPLDAPYLFSAVNSGNVGFCSDSSGSLVDTATVQDLAIQLVAADGSTEIVFRDLEAAGGTEVLTSYPVSGGGFVRIVGDGTPAPQLYDLVVQYVPEPRVGPAAGSGLITLAALARLRARRLGGPRGLRPR